MSIRNLIIGLLAWFLFSLIGGITGFFASQNGPPLTLGLAVILPLVLLVFFFRQKGRLYKTLQGIDLRYLVLAQTWRVIGLLFVVDYYRGLLPPGFAWPAGLGDFAIGVTAPLIAYLMRSNYRHKQDVFIIWNVLGILDLVVAVTMGILNSQSSFGILAGSTTTALMSVFPRNLIPTFLVPLFVFLHIVALGRNKEHRVADNQASVASG